MESETPSAQAEFTKFMNAAQDYRSKDNHLKEIGSLVRALEYDPKNYRVMVMIALAFGRMGCYEDATEYLNDALNINPDYFKAYNSLGNVFRSKGELGKALECYESAIARFPENFSIHYNRALTAMDLLMYPKAIESFEKAYALDSSETNILKDLGDIYYRTENYPKAVEVLEKYLEQCPSAKDVNQIRIKIKTIRKKLAP